MAVYVATIAGKTPQNRNKRFGGIFCRILLVCFSKRLVFDKRLVSQTQLNTLQKRRESRERGGAERKNPAPQKCVPRRVDINGPKAVMPHKK
jgi:hypothetical protein